MSNLKTAIIEIAGTDFSTSIMYKTQASCLTQVQDFVRLCGFDTEGDVQVNVYDPEYSLEVCVNKFYV